MSIETEKVSGGGKKKGPATIRRGLYKCVSLCVGEADSLPYAGLRIHYLCFMFVY